MKFSNSILFASLFIFAMLSAPVLGAPRHGDGDDDDGDRDRDGDRVCKASTFSSLVIDDRSRHLAAPFLRLSSLPVSILLRNI
ncbi:hypothetical protein BV25DRAFT_1824401, partial [Artomyces pyxidatus]